MKRGLVLATVLAAMAPGWFEWTGWTSGFVAGQSNVSSAVIQGVIRDSVGRAIPDVRVSLVAVGADGTERPAIARTNAQGEYVWPNLPPGTYTVTAELGGFQAARYSRLTLVANQTLQVDFKLLDGAVSSPAELRLNPPKPDSRAPVSLPPPLPPLAAGSAAPDVSCDTISMTARFLGGGAAPPRANPAEPDTYSVTLNKRGVSQVHRNGSFPLFGITAGGTDFVGVVDSADFAALCRLARQSQIEGLPASIGGGADGVALTFRIISGAATKQIVERNRRGPAELQSLRQGIEAAAQKIRWSPRQFAILKWRAGIPVPL